MPSLSGLALSLLPLALSSLGATLPSGPDSIPGIDIVGGTKATPRSFPKFLVALVINGTNIDCGGSLINARTIVTAAHCYVGEGYDNLNWWHVNAGSLDYSGGLKARVASVVTHPKYDGGSFDNDIALWQLSTPIYESSTIRYASLPLQGFDPIPGSNVTIFGWGSTNGKHFNTSKTLNQVTEHVMARKTCNDLYTGEVNDNMFCGDTDQGIKASCYSDSGGPVVDSVSYTLWGLVSWGTSDTCVGPDEPAEVFTRVANYIGWINKHKF